MTVHRRIARVVAAAALAASACLAAPAMSQAATPIGGGTPIVVGGIAGCTVTAAGTDGGGSPVAFTAAHCSEQLGAPVMLADDPGAGVVGTVVARNEVLDYSVVALNGRAVPVRQAGVNGRGPAPSFGDVVCKAGLATGYSCGITWQQQDGWFWSQMCAGHGDSGAPVIAGDRLVGLLSGGDMPPASGAAQSLENILPSCLLPPFQGPVFLPALAVSFDKVVADATARGWPGGGFRMA